MKELALSNIGIKTMTLKEITDLLEVDHSKAMSKVAVMAESREFGTVAILEVVYNKHGQTTKTYQLDKRQSIAVASRLNTELLMRVIDRWQELETAQYKLPQSYSEALRLCADIQDSLDQAHVKIAQDKPKVEFAEAVRRLDGACSVNDFAKVIGTGQNRLYKLLRDDGFLMANNRPLQSAIERGLLVSIEQTPYTDSMGVPHTAFKTLITGKGQVYFEKRYRKASKNGLVTLKEESKLRVVR